MPKRERSAIGALKKGPWSQLEDQILTSFVQEHGEGDWNRVGRLTGIPRSGKSCRLRWLNHLRADLKKGSFSHEEERLIVELHARFGNKWALIASQLPGRTDNDIKNFWNTRVKKHESAGWPLYLPGQPEPAPNTGPAPMVRQDAFLPVHSPSFAAGNVSVPPSFVQPNENAAVAYAHEATLAFPRVGTSLLSNLPPLTQYADQSREMTATPGFSPLLNADLEAICHLLSSTQYLPPPFWPPFGTTMSEPPSGQYLQTGKGSGGEPSSLPLHQVVDSRQHPHLLAAETALLQSISLPQAVLDALESPETTNRSSDSGCNEIRTESQSALPALMQQASDSRELSLGPNLNPEARCISAIRPDALLGLCQFFN